MPKKEKKARIRIYSSKNNIIITATDLTGAETMAWCSGGVVVDADREKGRPYAAMQAASKVGERLKEMGVKELIVEVRAPGGHGPKTPGPGAPQSAIRMFSRMGFKILSIEDVTPLPTDTTRRPGGKRGRRV